MDPIEEKIFGGLRATAPKADPALRNRVLDICATKGVPRLQRSRFALGFAVCAAILIGVQLVAVGILDGQERDLMMGGAAGSFQLAAKSNLDGSAVAQAIHARLQTMQALMPENDAGHISMKARTVYEHVQ